MMDRIGGMGAGWGSTKGKKQRKMRNEGKGRKEGGKGVFFGLDGEGRMGHDGRDVREGSPKGGPERAERHFDFCFFCKMLPFVET